MGISKKIIFYTKQIENDKIDYLNSIEWSLYRFVRREESKIRLSLRAFDEDLGNGLYMTEVIKEMNIRNCFDFDYIPELKDKLEINNGLEGAEYKYFSMIFRDGKWIKGAYYTHRLPAKGIRVIADKIANGKVAVFI